MTPYARLSTRLTRLREAENAAWGDRRLTGIAAHERMRGMLHLNVSIPTVSKILDALLKVGASYLPRRRRA